MKKKMTKEEKREFLKPYRCVGGFILFITIFTIIFNTSLIGIKILTNSLFGEGLISNLISEICMYGAIVYSYYVGYRIFLKKYSNNIKITKKLNYKKIETILTIITGFILVRCTWIVWFKMLNLIGYNTIKETGNTELYITTILYTAILAPIIEEIIFRGYILNTLKKYGTITAIIISSLTFGIFHGTIYQVVPTFLIGIILSIITLKHKSLIPGIIIHLTNNILSLALEYINISNKFEIVSKVIIVVLSIVIIIYLIILNRKKLLNYLKQILKSFALLYRSISYMFFLVTYLITIIFDLLNGIYNFIK